MSVQFQSDDMQVWYGFGAYFNQMPISNANCADWLNMNTLTLTTPDYPTINCKWIITTSMESTISINFHGFEVRSQNSVGQNNYYAHLKSYVDF